jgi:hypothetical protein
MLDKDTGDTLGVVSVMRRIKDVCELVTTLQPEQA